jgi:hypothetical protein
METRNRVAQIYGYAICLVAVIVFLINLAAFISAMFDLSDPIHADPYRDQGPSLASFENYKVDILASLKPGQAEPDDTTLQAMFEAARDDRIQSARLVARRTITISAILIVLSVGLFATHAIWLRRQAAASARSLPPPTVSTAA